MSVAIGIAAYGRPDYLRRTLESLVLNPEVHEWPVWFFLDGGHGSTVKPNLRVIKESGIPNPRLIARGENLGCGRNLIDLRRRLFDQEGYEWAFIFEDDMVVAPQYLGLLWRLAQWADQWDDVGTVQCSGRCYLPPDQKMGSLRRVRSVHEHYWGYALKKTAWDRIKHTLYDYEHRFLEPIARYRLRDHYSIRQFAAQLLRHPRQDPGPRKIPLKTPACPFKPLKMPTGQDAMTGLALWQAGYTHRLCTSVNRALYIGEQGEHFHKGAFRHFRFHEMQLDTFPQDTTIDDFELVGIQEPVDQGPDPLKAN